MTLGQTDPEPGDYIVHRREDGQCNIDMIDKDGRRTVVRNSGHPFDVAKQIATSGANGTGGRLLYSHYSDADSVYLFDPVPKLNQRET